MKIIGDRNTICFEIADSYSEGLLQVDIWAGNKLLTDCDNMTYVSAFIYSLNWEKQRIETRDIDDDFAFFDHGPTTDSFVSRIKIEASEASISFEFDDSIFHVSLPLEALMDRLTQVIEILTKKEHIQSGDGQ
ncbi:MULTISPECIES: hypothetical protein [unclassified Lentimonas]|uniref:hypothetical protein n=1 Tax=unclassified Lentimonas TaxID=2630993 RepID=UPI0013246941|nr:MULTISPECIES: hypothetical protein [unclassified Lentimonas]CAA6678061.1 Unannotated [Lentimonas sp. CC4]CAA6687454.1 Unannotated [Lentimonas sp. CC6]CAA7076346.1 Unannotated [Lentimonas sp. CC4]CAA7171996.1 Unannotated [Lentimonas sp. CC21]CAA7180680.1 Unannotated [Lentimonas sp. CC8]